MAKQKKSYYQRKMEHKRMLQNLTAPISGFVKLRRKK